MDKSVADMLSNPGIKDILSQLEQLQRLQTALGDSKLQELLASAATNTSTQAKPAPSPMPASSSSTMGPTAVNTPATCTPVTMPGQEFEDLSKLPVGTQMPYCAICVSFCNHSTEQHGKRPNAAEKKNDFDPRKIICKNCGKTGHSWKHCDNENFDEDRVLASIVAQEDRSNKGGRNMDRISEAMQRRGMDPAKYRAMQRQAPQQNPATAQTPSSRGANTPSTNASTPLPTTTPSPTVLSSPPTGTHVEGLLAALLKNLMPGANDQPPPSQQTPGSNISAPETQPKRAHVQEDVAPHFADFKVPETPVRGTSPAQPGPGVSPSPVPMARDDDSILDEGTRTKRANAHGATAHEPLGRPPRQSHVTRSAHALMWTCLKTF